MQLYRVRRLPMDLCFSPECLVRKYGEMWNSVRMVSDSNWTCRIDNMLSLWLTPSITLVVMVLVTSSILTYIRIIIKILYGTHVKCWRSLSHLSPKSKALMHRPQPSLLDVTSGSKYYLLRDLGTPRFFALNLCRRMWKFCSKRRFHSELV